MKNQIKMWKDACGWLITNEDGVGVIELVLILVVLIGLVAVFKTQINALLNTIFSTITSLSNEVL